MFTAAVCLFTAALPSLFKLFGADGEQLDIRDQQLAPCPRGIRQLCNPQVASLNPTKVCASRSQLDSTSVSD